MHGVHAWVHDSSAQAPGQALPWRPYPPQGPPVGRRRRAARRRRRPPQAPKDLRTITRAERAAKKNCALGPCSEGCIPHTPYPVPHTPYPVPMWLRRRRWMAIPHTPGGAGGGVPRSTPYPNTPCTGCTECVRGATPITWEECERREARDSMPCARGCEAHSNAGSI